MQLEHTMRHQLFVDDETIESTVRLTRKWHPPHYDYGSVLRADRPWEGAGLCTPVVERDPNSGRFRMWYRAYGMGTSKFPPYGWVELDGHLRGVGKVSNYCYAESDDGIHWEKPNLGLVEWRGSKDNNMVPGWGDRILDPLDPAPERRYKIFSCGPEEKERRLIESQGGCVATGHYVSFSGDGFGGTEPVLILPDCGDAHSFMYDPQLERPWVCFTRPPDYWSRHERRIVARLDSKDLVNWSTPEEILIPDLSDDEDVQFYTLYAFPYQSAYLGFVLRLHSYRDLLDVEVISSRDSKTWRRDPRRPAFMSPGAAGSWNSAWVAMSHNPPVDVFGDLYLFYEGRNGAHIAITPGPRSEIGLAITYEDRFASLSAGTVEGHIVTKPFTCPGGTLVLNANAFAMMGKDWCSCAFPSGRVSCEVLDGTGAAIPGYDRENCMEFRRNCPKGGAFTWKERQNLEALKGKTVKLKFRLQSTDLYSFWFAPEADQHNRATAPMQV